ncbi:unnamed protein product [Polarella glacialis]|uniref:NudC domain-containing protein 1 n=2 Tax=Polarella glacialis TaxID=89957 RepID=A0A813DVX4_POLGL|nr:unnamed protein product [Polarella glacialis]
MPEPTRDEMLAMCASLRAEHDIAAKARDGPAPEEAERTTDMTVGDALLQIENTMMGDKFWVDMARGVSRTRKALELNTEEGRSQAAGFLTELSDMILGLKMYFEAERNVIDFIRGLLRSEADCSNNTVLPGVRSTRSEGQTQLEASDSQQRRAQELAQLGAGVCHQYPMRNDSFQFTEVLNKQEVTVIVRVPPETAKSDVKVRFLPNSLRIQVQGHEVQPAVIDGELSGAIDVEASNWSLEGSGPDRRVVLDMEKTMGGFMWNTLLKGQ